MLKAIRNAVCTHFSIRSRADMPMPGLGSGRGYVGELGSDFGDLQYGSHGNHPWSIQFQ